MRTLRAHARNQQGMDAQETFWQLFLAFCFTTFQHGNYFRYTSAGSKGDPQALSRVWNSVCTPQGLQEKRIEEYGNTGEFHPQAKWRVGWFGHDERKQHSTNCEKGIVMMQRLKRIKLRMDDAVSRMLFLTFRGRRYKLGILFTYLCLHIVFILRQKRNLASCLRQIWEYEVWWYLIDIVILIFPYVIIWLLGDEEGKKIRQQLRDLSAFQDQKIITAFEVFVAGAGAISLYGLLTDSETLVFMYGRWYGLLLLFFVGLPLLAPCFFNMFIVVSAFWRNIDEAYNTIDDKEKLLKLGTQKIRCYKKVNTSFYCVYIGFLFLTTFAFSKTGVYRDSIESMLAFTLDYNLLMLLSTYGIPLAILITYYIASSGKIRRNLVDAMIRIELKKPIDEHEHTIIQFSFFDRNSPYYIRSAFGYPLWSFLATIIIAILPSIAEFFLAHVG